MNLRLIYIALGIFTMLVSSFVSAQTAATRTPLEQAKSYANLIRISIENCPRSITNLGLALQLKRLDPNNPLGKTPAEVAAKIDECAKGELASLPQLKRERVDQYAKAISERCKNSLDDLHIAVMVYYENFAADMSELLPVLERRVTNEANQLRNQASRAILVCG